MNKTIVFLGGDNRQQYIKQHILSSPLIYNNYSIIDLISPCKVTLEHITKQLEQANILIAPLPISSDKCNINIHPSDSDKAHLSIPFEHVINSIPTKSIIFAGGFNNEMINKMSSKHINYYDYLQDECIQVKNAVATAEGTIMKAMELSPINIQSSKCLVLGYGRCARILAKKLKGLDADTTICARNNTKLCECSSLGYKTLNLHQITTAINNFDFIFNTIPALIINSDVINHISKETTIIDIASSPGGVDYSYAKEKNIQAINYLGIPGKIAPKTSGYILGDYIINILEGLCVNH